MNKLDDMREDIRLAKLNGQSYRFMFGIFAFVGTSLKLLLLGCFAVVIWYLLYGYEMHRPTGNGGATATSAVIAENEPLSKEQISRLREFANNHRKVVAKEESVATGDAVQLAAANPVLSDSRPRVLVQSVSANDSVQSLPDAAGQIKAAEKVAPLPDISAKSVLAELELKLGAEADDPGNLIDPNDADVQAVVDSPIVQASSSELPSSFANDAMLVTEFESDLQAGSVAVKQVQNEQWVLKQNSQHYMIQIGSTTNRPFLVRFEKQLPENQSTAIFEMLIGSSREHTLTYGVFATQELANSALNRLTRSARRYGAYVRKISAIQKQVRDLGADLAIAQKAEN